MNILIIGGTGTMGKPLVDLLKDNHNVTVVCRKKVKEINGVEYFYGDANNLSFLRNLLKCHYDSIVDFSWCSSSQFEAKFQILLDATAQYFCLSSAAVVADGAIPLMRKHRVF